MSPPAKASAASVDRVMSRDIDISLAACCLLLATCEQREARSEKLFLGPDHALFLFRDVREALVDEPLHAFAFVRLGCIDVAFRVGCDGVDGVELPGLTA